MTAIVRLRRGLAAVLLALPYPIWRRLPLRVVGFAWTKGGTV